MTQFPDSYIDIAYTAIPREAKLFPKDDADLHVTFNALTRLGSIAGKQEALQNLPPSDEPNRPSTSMFPNEHGHFLEPDDQLLCFDFLYWVSSSHIFEWEQDYSSAWNLVGKYARWNDEIRSVAREALALTLGVSRGRLMVPTQLDEDYDPSLHGNQRYPPKDLRELDDRDTILYPYIVIHARRGDFINYCANETVGDCFPPLSSFQREVEAVREELWSQKGINVKEEDVIVTSNDRSSEWWDEVAKIGWKRVQIPDSIRIEEEEGEREDVPQRLWKQMLVEAAIQGWSAGFVGTRGSTMSLLAKRRVEEWQKGSTRFIGLD